MDQNLEKLKNITTEIDGDILFVTVAKYKLFLSYGKIGMDALIIYLHLMFTARIQKTNQVWAKNVYLRECIEWGEKRLKKAKKLLVDLGLIEYIQNKKEDGTFGEFYIKVKTRTTPFEIKSIDNPDVSSTATGGSFTALPENRTHGDDQQMLKRTSKCLNEQVNAYNTFYETIFNYWKQFPMLQQHKSITTLKRKFTKTKIKEILEEYTTEEIKKAIYNYNTILAEEQYYFKHTWTLWHFLTRGVDNFVDKSKPFIKYIKNTYNNIPEPIKRRQI